MSKFWSALPSRGDFQDSDQFVGYRDAAVGGGGRWTWGAIKGALASLFAALIHTHASHKETIDVGSPHGFTPKQAVYCNSGAWALAKADNIDTCYVTGVIESVPTPNSFVIVYSDKLDSTGWAENTTYFLSATVAGLLTNVQPTSDEHFVVSVARTGASAVAYVRISDPLPLALIPDSALQNPRPASATQSEMEAGTEPALRSVSPLRIAQAISALAPTGAGGAFQAGEVILYPTAGLASIPAGFIVCDGSNGTPNVAAIGALSAIIKHAGTVATPTFTPAPGTFSGTQNVTIDCATSAVVIKFTTDGSTPSRTVGTTYTAPVAVSSTATIKAIAFRLPTDPTLTMIDSALASGTFTISAGDTTPPTVGTPSINAAGNQLTIPTSENVSFGAGGNGGFALTSSGGAVTLTYLSGSGTSALVYTTSRTIYSTETLTLGYTQPGAGVQDAAANDMVSFSGTAVTNNSTQSPVTFLIDEQFEAGGLPSGWTDYNFPDYYATPALEGTKSVRLAGDIRNFGKSFGSDHDELWGRFRVRFNSISAGGDLVKFTYASGDSFRLYVNASGQIMADNFSASFTTNALATGTDYYVWFHFKKDTGAGNAVGEVWFSTTSTRPTSGGNVASNSSGSQGAPMARISFVNTSSGAFDVLFDDVKVATADF